MTIAVCDDHQGIPGEFTAEIEQISSQRNEIRVFPPSSDLLLLIEAPVEAYFLDIYLPEVDDLVFGEAFLPKIPNPVVANRIVEHAPT